jgi:hypothetical protein
MKVLCSCGRMCRSAISSTEPGSRSQAGARSARSAAISTASASSAATSRGEKNRSICARVASRSLPNNRYGEPSPPGVGRK